MSAACLRSAAWTHLQCSTGGQAHQAHWCPSPKRLQTLFSQVGRYRYLYIGWELAKCTVRTYPASGGAVLGAPEQTGEEAIVGYHTPISITGRVHSAACIQRRGLDAPGPYGHAKRTANRQQKDRRAYVGDRGGTLQPHRAPPALQKGSRRQKSSTTFTQDRTEHLPRVRRSS